MDIIIGGVKPQQTNDVEKRLSCLIWGKSGVGKTLLASTAPGRKLWLSFDPDGLITVEDKIESGEITAIDLSSSNYAIVQQGCTDNCFGLEQYLKENLFDTIIFDSATTYLDLCLKLGIVGIKGAKVEAPSMLGYSKKNSFFKQTMVNLIKLTGKYNKNLIIIAHEDTPKMNDDGTIIEISPLIGGNSAESISIMLSEVWYLGNFNGTRKLLFKPMGVIKRIKSRIINSDKSPNLVWNYNPETREGNGINTIYDKWKENNYKKIVI